MTGSEPSKVRAGGEAGSLPPQAPGGVASSLAAPRRWPGWAPAARALLVARVVENWQGGDGKLTGFCAGTRRLEGR